MKILLTADLHMGRRPSRLPSHIDTSGHSTTRCWSAVVDTAIAEEVDLVALSGDVVDQANRYYEAVGPFEEGLKRLAGKGIRVLAVAGNHDHETLRAIAGNFPPETFTLLGRGGVWERVTIEREGEAVLHVDGWSFPQASHTEDPLRDYRPAPDNGVPVLGLLHCDLDAVASRYAPVRLTDLRLRPPALWLLGHIHRPALSELQGASTVLYPGSPQAMDPGEEELHGVWIAEMGAGKRFTVRQVPLSTVRYGSLDVDISGADTEAAVDLKVSVAVRAELQSIVSVGCGPLRYLSLRLRLTGRTPLHGALSRRGMSLVSELAIEESGVTALVERAVLATSPELDLEELARRKDAPAILARLALAIDAGELTAEQQDLLQKATRAATDVHGARPYSAVCDTSGAPPPGEVAMEILREHSLLLLDTMLAQKEALR
jgi:DNA repair exonuclease SbcCD nuclease subunit